MRARPQEPYKNRKERNAMSRNEMVRYWHWLMNQGDHEAAKEVEYSFYDLWNESIFDYV